MGGPMGAPMGGGGGPRPQRRNPIMVLGLTLGLNIGGNILGGVLGAIDPSLVAIGSLVSLVGSVLFLVFMVKMLLELKAFTNDQSFNWWFIFIPCLNIYFIVALLPAQVTKAKQMAGTGGSAKSAVAYFFLSPSALASDLNDIAG